MGDQSEYKPFSSLERSSPLWENEFVSAGGTDNTGRCITFGVLVIGVIKGGEAAACAHLSLHMSVELRWRGDEQTSAWFVKRRRYSLYGSHATRYAYPGPNSGSFS